MSDLRDRFHFAKLTQSQARYLSALSRELEKNPNSANAALYMETMKLSGHQNPPSPVNQAVFLQMAYVSLVWLSEALTCKQRGEIRKEFTLDDFCRADFSKYSGEDKVSSYFKHIRNSLAHARVRVSDKEPWSFELDSEHDGIIELPVADLGGIADKWLHRVSDMIWDSGPTKT